MIVSGGGIRFTIKVHDFFAKELVWVLNRALWEDQSEISVAVLKQFESIRIIFEQNCTIFRDRLSGVTRSGYDLGNSRFFDGKVDSVFLREHHGKLAHLVGLVQIGLGTRFV